MLDLIRNLKIHPILCTKESKHFSFSSVTLAKMVKPKENAKKNSKAESSQAKETSPIELDKSNNILIKVLAKPGAKQNSITDFSTEGVGIQINAPPVEGEANTELVRYVCQVLGLRKSNMVLDKGMKSRQKTLKVESGSITKEEVEAKLRKEMEGS